MADDVAKGVEAPGSNSVGQLIREMETAFISGGGTLTSKYVTSDLYDDISKIYAYLASAHWSGETDALGRDKPFFNMVISNRNIYFRATDLDRSNATIKPGKLQDAIPAFAADVLLQDWMKKENFGQFLNDWGLDLAGFNSSVVKFIESGRKLYKMVVPWSRIICDQVDFDNNPKIETLELTEAQLKDRVRTHGYDKDMVEALCTAQTSRHTTDGQQKDQKAHYIKLYELHAVLPLSYVTEKETDEDDYVQQMHVLSFVAKKEGNGKIAYDDYTLVKGREDRDPYMLTSLLPNTDGSVSLDGSVKNLFQAQWMMNHTVKSIKDSLDIGSKLLFQTADKNFLNRNVLSALETGDILLHEDGKELTLVNNTAININAAESFGQMWKGLASEINGVSESMLGNTAPSGTAWRQVEALLNESHSLFDLMRENKALHLEQMLRRFIIPYLKKQLDHSDEIAAILEAHNVTKIDAMYVPAEAAKRYNARTKPAILDPKAPLPQPFDPVAEQAAVTSELATQGNQRFFVPSELKDVTWKEVLKDLEWKVEIDITDESRDLNSMLTTLSTALQMIMNPAYGSNKQAQMVVGKILAATGQISPLEIAATPPPPPAPSVPTPNGGGTGGLPA